MSDDAYQDRRKQVEAFLKHAKKRREQEQATRQARTDELKQRSQDQLAWAKEQAKAQDNLVAQKRAQFEQWRKKQKEEKAEIAEMLRKKEEERLRLEQRKEELAEREAAKKKYMQELRYANALKMAKEKRARVAKDAKDFALKDAEHDYRRDTELAEREYKDAVRSITEEARSKRGLLDGELEELLSKVEKDTKEEQSALFKKQKVREQSLLNEFMRKEDMLRRANQLQQLHALEREKKRTLDKFTQQCTKQKTDVEVQRNTRIMVAKDQIKKTREAIDEHESDSLEDQKRALQQRLADLERKFTNDRKLAQEREQEILQMDLQDIVKIDNQGQEDLDED